MVGLSFQTGGHFYLLLVIQSVGYMITRSFFVSHWRFKQPKTKVKTKTEGSIPFKTKNWTTPGTYQHGIWH
jgi:predicted membrane channel-forming protein YqfA (hemolysin III family)